MSAPSRYRVYAVLWTIPAAFFLGVAVLADFEDTQGARLVPTVVGLCLLGYAASLWRWQPTLPVAPHVQPLQQPTQPAKSSDTADGCLGVLFLLMVEPTALILGPIFFLGLYWFWPHWQEFLIGFLVLSVIVGAVFNM